MEDLFSKCGNNCGRCALYRDNLTDEKRQWCADGMGRYINWHPTPEKLRQCAGCQATDGFLYIKNCGVRRCAQHNGVENCAYCSAFPCRDVPTVSLSVDYRAQVAERFGGPVPEEDYLAFIEPYEGMKHLEGIHSSLTPKDLVEPAGVSPLRTRIAEFPDDLPFREEEIAPFRTLHELMADILSARVDLYVRQVALRKRRQVILSLLWVFGCYSELKDEDGSHLVVASETHGTLAEFNNIVRKRDNALHGPAAASARLLQDLGVSVEHVPLARKEWLLKMSFDGSAGGKAALRALKSYTTRLVENHGKPVYAGSSRYKGEAFARFSKADMQVLSEDR